MRNRQDPTVAGRPGEGRHRRPEPGSAGRDPAGTGLGLATRARIAAAHGGRLEISANPSGGTTVSIHLGAP
ncbi:MAG TPA: sensor histidine kinase [Arthrobacter sp.]|nr:sensor histidine kinase [Arthrobacter sp.]